MPTSHFNQISTIVEIMFKLEPRSVLDIGIGYGKYGMLAREYLEKGNYKPYLERRVKIDGIEAFPEYVQEGQRFYYDNIFIGDALEILPMLESYDLILIADVLEHFNQEDGLKLLELCYKKGKHILISTPLDIGVQGSVYGNEYERHRFQWRRYHFKNFQPVTFFQSYQSMLCLIGSEGMAIRKKMSWKNFKLWLISLFPSLYIIYQKLKN